MAKQKQVKRRADEPTQDLKNLLENPHGDLAVLNKLVLRARVELLAEVAEGPETTVPDYASLRARLEEIQERFGVVTLGPAIARISTLEDQAAGQ